jgi:hypothetical protein
MNMTLSSTTLSELASAEQPLCGDDRKLEQLFGIPRQTWRNYRVSGYGPPYSKVGTRCYYDLREVAGWLESKKIRSTSQSPAFGKGGVA